MVYLSRNAQLFNWTQVLLKTSDNINSTIRNSDFEKIVVWDLILQCSFLVIICILSLLGNSVVAVALFKKEQLLTPSNRLVFNLTASNFCFSLLVLPFVLSSHVQQEWKFGIFWCNFSAFFTHLVGFASIITLAMIAIDRYYAIVKPMAYTLTMTTAKSSAMMLWSWIQACVCSLPPLFGLSRFEFQPTQGACVVVLSANLFYTTFVFTTCVFLPFVVMSTCYYYIFQVARTKRHKVHVGVVSDEANGTNVNSPASAGNLPQPLAILQSSLQNNAHSSSALESPSHLQNSAHKVFPPQQRPTRRSLTRKPSWLLTTYTSPVKGFWTICLVLGAFLMTWLPYVVLAIGEMACPYCLPDWFRTSALWMTYCSSVSYPFIYGFYNRTIRKEVRGCLCPPSSKALQGLPRRNSRRLSFSGSLLDFVPFRGRNFPSRRVSSDYSRASVDLGTFGEFLRFGNRKSSQDSGAVFTESDLETEASFLPPSWVHRRVSAPSHLQLFTSNRGSRNQTQDCGLNDLHPLPILQLLSKPESKTDISGNGNVQNVEKSNENVGTRQDSRTNRNSPITGHTKADISFPIIPLCQNTECIQKTPLFSCKKAWEIRVSSIDEGIVNDCVVEDLE